MPAAGQFTTEAEAKGQLPVRHRRLGQHQVEHIPLRRPREYGTTKQGAYMCEADANAAGDAAAKNEKPKP